MKFARRTPALPNSRAMTHPRQIVAFGGGGFSMEAGNPLLDDYVLFRGIRLTEVVASRPGARAFRVHAVDGEAVEEEIVPRLLNAPGHARAAATPAVEELRALRAARRGWRGG